jgi:hypothetical protein
MSAQEALTAAMGELADAVFSGIDRTDRTPAHLAVEASITIGHDDVWQVWQGRTIRTRRPPARGLIPRIAEAD